MGTKPLAGTGAERLFIPFILVRAWLAVGRVVAMRCCDCTALWKGEISLAQDFV